jgi:prepilin peptidase CpaA
MDMFLLFKIFFWAFVGLMGAAAVFDLWKFIIPNWISVALLGLFIAAAVFLPTSLNWLSHLGAMGIVLAGTLLLYRFNMLGGGDLKLLTVAGLWVGLEFLPTFILYTALAGGALSLGLLVLRRLLTGVLVLQSGCDRVTLPRVLLPGEHIPYGIAIAAGAIWVARELPHLGLFA